MPANDFKTISDDLLHVAVATESFFLANGYNVDIEERPLGGPFTPAMVARRGHETVIVEVAASIDEKRVERWTRFGMSQKADTRLSLVLRKAATMDDMDYADTMRIGLMSHDDKKLREIRAPSDLAVHVVLPDLADLKPEVRAVLAGAFKKFNADWRDGLGDAYNEVEQQSREYLKAGIRSGRAVINKTKKGIVTGQITEADVDKMTLGALKDAFAKIQKRNHADETIFNTLSVINKTRVGLAHKKKVAAVEEQLRKEAGGHMYACISCLEDMPL